MFVSREKWTKYWKLPNADQVLGSIPKGDCSIEDVLIRDIHAKPKEVISEWMKKKPVVVFRIIAVVKRVARFVERVAFQLDDETGSITAQYWNNPLERYCAAKAIKNHTKLKETIPDRRLVAVYGHPLQTDKTFVKHLKILYIEVVNDYGPAFNHLILVREHLRGQERPVKFYSDAAKMIIVDIITTSTDRDGMNRADIKKNVPRELVNKTDRLLQALLSEGVIYTTINKDLFKAV